LETSDVQTTLDGVDPTSSVYYCPRDLFRNAQIVVLNQLKEHSFPIFKHWTTFHNFLRTKPPQFIAKIAIEKSVLANRLPSAPAIHQNDGLSSRKPSNAYC